jgi:hypothetical protein
VAQIDDRDREVLELLAEHRMAVGWHAARLLGVSRGRADARLRALAQHGYVRREQIFSGQPPAVWITRKGMAVLESRLPPPRPDLRGYRHDVGLAWLWVAARQGAFGALSNQVSERTMRSHDRRADRGRSRFGLGIGAGVHYPDLLLETATGHRIAVELELTPKSRRRLDRIMLAYAGSGQIDGVLYLCPPGPVAEHVRDAARRAGISRLVHVQRLAAGGPQGAPDPVVTRTRPASRRRVARGAER